MWFLYSKHQSKITVKYKEKRLKHKMDLSYRDKKSDLKELLNIASKANWNSCGSPKDMQNSGDAGWNAALTTKSALIGMHVLLNLSSDSENHPLRSLTSHRLKNSSIFLTAMNPLLGNPYKWPTKCIKLVFQFGIPGEFLPSLLSIF